MGTLFLHLDHTIFHCFPLFPNFLPQKAPWHPYCLIDALVALQWMRLRANYPFSLHLSQLDHTPYEDFTENLTQSVEVMTT